MVEKTKGSVMDKKTRESLAGAMRLLLDKIEDPKVEIRDARMECTNGNTRGAAPGSGFAEYRFNGLRMYAITLDIYESDLDKAREDGSWWKEDPSIGEVVGRVPWTD